MQEKTYAKMVIAGLAVAMSAGSTFAAALPCCGGGDVAQAPRLTDIPIWAFHGSDDKGVPVCRSRDMVAAIKAAGGKKILYREYKGLGHNVWTPTFSDDKVFEWLFSQRRGK